MAQAASRGCVCIAGESLIDMLPRTIEDKTAFLPCPGGAPFNALLAAKRLGLQVKYLATLSTDMFGAQLLDILVKEGVDVSLVERIDRPTTLAFVSRSEGQGEKYAFFKENAADRGLTKAKVEKAFQPGGALANCFAVHVSLGAVTLEDLQMKEAFETLFWLAGKTGAMRTFDPNLRKNMISDAASYKNAMERFLRNADVVKCSDDDLAFLYGMEQQNKDAIAEFHLKTAQDWLGFGLSFVIITKGGHGSTAYYPDGQGAVGQIHIPVPRAGDSGTVDAAGNAAAVVDTVGCGDTFMGSFISGIQGGEKEDSPLKRALLAKEAKKHEDSLRVVLQRASLCAAINASRAGCNPPTTEEAAAAEKKLSSALR